MSGRPKTNRSAVQPAVSGSIGGRTRWIPANVGWVALLSVTALVAVLHIATNGRYGFGPDELQFIDDARHLAWGFVAYPPFTPFVERIAFALFGTSLVGLRLPAVLGQAAVLVLTGLLAADFGGGRFAQIAAALAVAAGPLSLLEGHEVQYTGFDMLWCVALAWCFVRRANSDRQDWWLLAGAVAGLGLMTKYSMAFYLCGLVVGILLTPARRLVDERRFWQGAALALIIFLPNLIWQFRHGWVTLHFLQSIHARDIAQGRTRFFWREQVEMLNFAAPLAAAGLAYFFLPAGRHYRALGWMFVVVLAILWSGTARGYYTDGLYPMLVAAGCAFWEAGLRRLGTSWLRRAAEWTTVALLLVSGALTARYVLPLEPAAAPGNPALGAGGDLADEVGWPDLVAEIARIRDGLPPAVRARAAVLTLDYGETGAVDLYGPRYGLPPAISPVNSAWYRGYGNPPPTTLIVVGSARAAVEQYFAGCRLAGHDTNRYGLANDESKDHPDIFVCGPPLIPWPIFWGTQPSYG